MTVSNAASLPLAGQVKFPTRHATTKKKTLEDFCCPGFIALESPDWPLLSPDLLQTNLGNITGFGGIDIWRNWIITNIYWMTNKIIFEIRI